MMDTIKPHSFKMPFVAEGMRVGLFGGSFNPPHLGHVLLCKIALKRLNLHQIWWMVTPQNPLKDPAKLASLESRIEKCEALVSDPRIKITGFEARYGLHYSADTLNFIKKRHRSTHFIWLMGADNLKNFHKWKQWEQIVHTFPIAIIDRPKSTFTPLSSRFSVKFERAKLPELDTKTLVFQHAPAWSFIHAERSSLSSSAL